jgi:hypothetical protein
MQDCRVKSAASLFTKRRDLSSFFFGVQNPDTKIEVIIETIGNTQGHLIPTLHDCFCNI